MMENDIIVVIPSKRLSDMRMEPLLNHKMEVTEPVYSKEGGLLGCWASLIDETFLGEKEWFIPYESIFIMN